MINDTKNNGQDVSNEFRINQSELEVGKVIAPVTALAGIAVAGQSIRAIYNAGENHESSVPGALGVFASFAIVLAADRYRGMASKAKEALNGQSPRSTGNKPTR